MRVEGKRAVRRRISTTMSSRISLPREHVLSITGEIIEQASLIFDPIWYVVEYPDIGAAGVDPVQHFLKVGFSEGRNPNRYFDGAWYAKAYPDVAAHGENPFVHYVFYGAREGRKPRAEI